MNEEIMHIELEKPRLNPIHFAAIIGGALLNAFIVGGVYVSINRDIADISKKQVELSTRIDGEASDRKDLLKGYQDSLNGMQKDISQIQPLSYQATRALESSSENKKATEEGLKNVNERMDRVVGAFSGKLDVLVETVNKVSTQVQVFGSKLDDLQGRGDKTTSVGRP
jgi:methyl-accepting chemotaxis protein